MYKFITVLATGFLMVTLLSACGSPTSLPPTATHVPPTATAVPDTPTPIPTSTTPITRGKVDVGGYRLNIMCKNEGSPTIVIDVGWGGEMLYLMPLYAKIPEDMGVRVCTYDRVGAGQSDPGPYEARTNLDMAEDLHNLLYYANIPGPYILVAHDMAGFTARLFADRYRDDVAGLVLVDVLHPDWHNSVLALFPSASAEDSPGVQAFREFHNERVKEPLSLTENWDIPASEEQVRSLGSLGNLPLVVMTRDTTQPQLQLPNFVMDYGEIPFHLAEDMDKAWLELQEDLVTLSTNSKHIIVENTNHMLPRQEPDSVIDAIRWVLGEVRGE